MSAPAWMWLTHWGARAVLLVLVGLSITSVAVILDRRKFLKQRQTALSLDEIKALFLTGKLEGAAPGLVVSQYAGMLTGKYSQASTEAVDRATRSFLTQQRNDLERGMTFLATIGSNAPFIGLFGTVLGIIQAFGELSSSQSGSTSVMGAISEALVATAVGLLVAIPAVIAFNTFQRRVRELLLPCEILRDEFIAQRGLQATDRKA